MLKVIGAGLILFAATVLGLQLKLRVAEHLRQLVGLKEMLLMLSGEMSYGRTPLAEAFSNIAGQGKAPYDRLLLAVSRRAEQEQELALSQIWQSEAKKQKEHFLLSGEEFSLLLGVGENFGYLDLTMQLGHIALSIQQVENRIVLAQGELSAKQKMYQYLSVMCGLFLILILI